ncbi:MAG: 2-oxoglutarate dehydrogenase complex dihydrolipoyllysine-residue succinyltransferase [Bacteroidota bacterium]|jgi:2-oxoglutarate dehydrogenase E2 component (dihydrolipoamide succinyltransferase)|nr:2-oxoglutarate dehydrogenase complex dihydrolipoyllysine-residue succinyltransferase [Bacteroidota bacterium]HNZ68766.1 2-oxoglutarate dehydrogenase complex dihydrolipoyllysine-residue succinyltransferase [Prolixibacteraceae bacterium]HOF55640.1 2-oxoglutarate dehydrogenase complex dihydrolipoyllysine-residue succinyltransferase [Prolixibacteraceae bacterium]HOS00658.1 2-oxoglutarate dehydrogenase complex dihydrolipoyllysine-residue succinyltransferase [Prolixibacteraceae bacterium]HOS89940.
MIIEMKIPSPGESIIEVEVGRWLAEEGSLVRKGDEIAEIESDKATLSIVAEESGRLTIVAREGERVAVGSVACTIDTSVEFAGEASRGAPETHGEEAPLPEAALPRESREMKHEEREDVPPLKITAVAREVMKTHNLSVDDLIKGLKRIGKKEVEAVVRLNSSGGEAAMPSVSGTSREVSRERMTPLRRRLSERLVAVKNETAMLTTFNEVDMSSVMEIRKQYQQKFSEKHGFRLGFMSFFTKAAALAVGYHPAVNAMIDGEEIVFPTYVDIGIAVQTPKGLMVPVVRNAESKSLPQIELEIKELAEKARSRKITVEELSGGTFTITNGGVFGSLLSTPILNPPQSAILGMHNIIDRPVALNGKVEIRPMMYIALSYDHRVIDGKDSVGFLVTVKELIENPRKMLLGGRDPLDLLLEL